jgi:hypothetical protein
MTHAAYLDVRGANWCIDQLYRILADVNRVITDPFEVDVDLQHRRDLTQLAGQRLLLPHQLDALAFDLPAQRVDFIVASDDASSKIDVALLECRHGGVQGVACERSKPDAIQASIF